MNTRKDWITKLQQEQALSLAESHQLDEALEAQSSVREALGQLSDDAPSMAWRSSLNERLLAVQPQPRRRATWWRWAGVGTAVAASAVTLISVTRMKPTSGDVAGLEPRPAITAEQVMLDTHQSAAFALSAGTGDGSTPISEWETAPVYQWTEADVEAF